MWVCCQRVDLEFLHLRRPLPSANARLHAWESEFARTTERERVIKSMSFTVDNKGREGLAEQPAAGAELYVACREGALNL